MGEIFKVLLEKKKKGRRKDLATVSTNKWQDWKRVKSFPNRNGESSSSADLVLPEMPKRVLEAERKGC